MSCPGILPATGWIANLTLTPLDFKSFAISPIAYYPYATASPYPGTIITDFELTIRSTTDSAEVSVCVPVISIYFPPKVA